MSRSGDSSRSTSSYSSSGKVPLQCQSGLYPQLATTAPSLTSSPDSKQRSTYDSYDPRYPSSMSDSRYASSSKSSSSKSSRSSRPDKIPLSISHGSTSSPRDSGNSKANDERYYQNSSLDYRKPEKKPLSFQKGNDPRYYSDSSYYR